MPFGSQPIPSRWRCVQSWTNVFADKPSVPPMNVEEVVARLEAIARIDLPEDTTDVTDRVDEVEEQVSDLVARDRAFRHGLLAVSGRHPDPKVRQWAQALVVPSAWAAVAEPERLYAQPGVPIRADTTPTRAALTLGARTQQHLSLLKRRRAASKPWTDASAWMFGHPQASSAVDLWPTADDGKPLSFVLQVDLAEAENNVAPYEFSRTGLPATGVLQVYAHAGDRPTADEPTLVAHRVLHLPPESMLDRAADAPSGISALAAVRPVGIDTMATLPHEEDVAPDYDWDEQDLDDYRVLKEVLEADPYERNPHVTSPVAVRSPVDPDHRPVAPLPRLGGHLLVPRRLIAPAVSALDCEVDDVFPLLDVPLDTGSDACAARPSRVLVLARLTDVVGGRVGSTVALQYLPLPHPMPHTGA